MAHPIDEVFFEKHRISRGALHLLSAGDVEELRRIVVHRVDNPNRVRALGFLVQLGDPAATDAIRGLLTDPNADQDLRAAAAALAARIGAGAQSALVEGLRYASEPWVRRRIAASLGEIGNPAAGDPLRQLSEDHDEAVRAQAEFSLSVLSAREGIDGFRLPIPNGDNILRPRPEDARRFTVHRASLNETAIVLDSLAGRTYGMGVTADAVYAIVCGPDGLMLVMDQRSTLDNFIDQIASRPSLIGLVATPAPDEKAYSVQWLILSWPENRESLHVAVHRPSGQQIFYGRAGVEGAGINFGLESLGGPGRLAVRLRGQLAGGSVEIHEALAAERREPASVPRPFAFPGTPTSHQ